MNRLDHTSPRRPESRNSGDKSPASAQFGTLAELLSHSIDAGVTSVQGLSISGEISDERVAHYAGRRGKLELPKVCTLRRWLSEASVLPRKLKDSILLWFLRGTGYRFHYIGVTDLLVMDRNGDGLIDERDQIAPLADAACQTTEAAREAVQAWADGKFSAAEKAKVRAIIAEARERLREADEAIDNDGMRIKRGA